MDEVARQCAAMMHGMHGPIDGGWRAGGMMDMGGMQAVSPLWLLIIAALTALLVVGVVGLLRRRERPEPNPAAPSIREVLDGRYAAGELDRDTYLQMRSDLGIAG